MRLLSQQLFGQILYFKQICERLKNSIRLAGQFKNYSENQSAFTQQAIIQRGKQIPQIILKDIKNVLRVKQIDITQVANKLKVFVAKTLKKQSSKLRYNFNPYITDVMQQITQFKFNEGYQKFKQQFNQIRRQFNVVNDVYVNLHRHHPTAFSFHSMPQFYISFYQQRLLFFQNQPLPFNSNLLFVPIMYYKNKNPETDKFSYSYICSWYINQLQKQNVNWQNYSFQVTIKNLELQTIEHCFFVSFQKKGLESQICANLRKIRCYVYLSMLFNYLKHVFLKNQLAQNKKQIHLYLKQNLLMQIRVDRKQLQSKPSSNPKIIKAFFKYFEEQKIMNRSEYTQVEVVSNFTNYFLCILAQIKYNIEIPQQYKKIKPKYVYVKDKRVQI